jgi:hypothetical protein
MATMWTYPFRIAQRPPHPAKSVVFLLTANDRTGGALVVKVQFGERREWTGLERTNIADFPPSADPKSFSKGGIMRHAMILFLTSVVSVSFSGCGPSKAEVSKGHMGAIGVAISQYKETYNRWPDELEQLLPFMNNERICFANPLTGDDPAATNTSSRKGPRHIRTSKTQWFSTSFAMESETRICRCSI